MRLIDADALKAYFHRPYSNEESYTNTDLDRIIDNAPTIKAFTLADIEAQYRKGLEKGLEEAETKKCPIFSDDEVKQPCVKSPCGFERPHGEWIECEWVDPRLVKYRCSVCNYKYTNGSPNFCPNCGVSMKKEGEGNENI